jgi:hypothetical protein
LFSTSTNFFDKGSIKVLKPSTYKIKEVGKYLSSKLKSQGDREFASPKTFKGP